MKAIGDVDLFIREAQARAQKLAAELVAVVNGPTLALLTLHAARAEVLRLAKERIPPAEWERFVAEQRRLEGMLDRRADVLRGLGRSVVELFGGKRG